MIKLILLIAISYNSCFSHQDIVPVIENTNGFNFKGDYFPINQTLITANTIIDNTPVSMPVVLSNIAAINTTAMSGVNDFRFAHEATDIVPGDITPILKYSLCEHANCVGFRTKEGTTILSDVTIHSISADEMDLAFLFSREDKKVINRAYKGKYLKRSN